MCYYSLKTVLPKLEDEQIINLCTKANNSGYEHCFSAEERYTNGRLPYEMFRIDNICVYSYFALGSTQRLCIIPINEKSINEFKEKGVIINEVE